MVLIKYIAKMVLLLVEMILTNFEVAETVLMFVEVIRIKFEVDKMVLIS